MFYTIEQLNNLPEQERQIILAYNPIKLSKNQIVVSVEGLEALREYKKNKPGETLPQQIKHLAGSMTQWAKEGLKKVPEHVYNRRINICRGCEFWEEDARLGYGKCRKCGCGKGKHWLPHEQCPIGKWGKENQA